MYRILTAFVLVAGACLVLTGCGDSAAPPEVRVESEPAAVRTAVCSPLRLAVLLDQTRSTTWTAVPQATPEFIGRLAALLHCGGGELGITFIRESSGRAFLRLCTDRPPALEPSEPAETNPIAAAERQQREEALQARNQQHRKDWESRTLDTERAFIATVTPLLAAPLAGRTDLWRAIRRADVYLAESDDYWAPQHTVRVLLAATDAEDNVRAPTVDLTSGAKVLLVPGATGDLAPLHPVRLESLEAALRYLEAAQQRERNAERNR